jgi:oligoribonuclease NrnB/cAMP/cGMP phosphodiesterase (DHH superfamily)
MTDTRPLVIYHGHCVDGFTAAWVAHRYYRERGLDAELLAASYGDEPPNVTGRDVLIVDFTYPRETLLAMHEQAAALLVLDHHRSAEEALRGLPFATFDMQRSGAGLAWDTLFPGQPRPWLVDYVEDRDLWRWHLPWSREVSAGLALYDFDLGLWNALGQQESPDFQRSAGVVVTHYQARQTAKHVERARPARIAGYLVPVVNATTLISEIGNELAKAAPFAALWWADEGGVHYSLRSCPTYVEHVDVSVIAGLFGGGGHRHAAGFKVPALVHEAIASEETSDAA